MLTFGRVPLRVEALRAALEEATGGLEFTSLHYYI